MNAPATIQRDLRAEFPGLVTAEGKPWHYLDTAATAQKPSSARFKPDPMLEAGVQLQFQFGDDDHIAQAQSAQHVQPAPSYQRSLRRSVA